MTTATEKLTKILNLEAEKCQDRAVFGGLVQYADTWLQEAETAFGPDAADWKGTQPFPASKARASNRSRHV